MYRIGMYSFVIKCFHLSRLTIVPIVRVIFVGVNFCEKPQMAFRNKFRDSNICGDYGTCAHAQRETAWMTYYDL